MLRGFIFPAVLVALAPCLIAAEQHGIVKSNGLPIPGATVTATKGDKKLATTTDEQGAYTFPDMEDGAWTITVEMLGFDKISREVTVAPSGPSLDLDLRLLSLQAFNQSSNKPTPAAPTPERSATPANPPAVRTPQRPAPPRSPRLQLKARRHVPDGRAASQVKPGMQAGPFNAWT